MTNTQTQPLSTLGMIWGAKDIGQRIGKSERKTFYMLQTGQIPAQRIGSQWVTTEQALQDLVRSIGAEKAA